MALYDWENLGNISVRRAHSDAAQLLVHLTEIGRSQTHMGKVGPKGSRVMKCVRIGKGVD